MEELLILIQGISPMAGYILAGLGSLVVILSAVDAAVPDAKDKGFFKKILAIPLLGDLLKGMIRFSLFRSEKKDEE